MWYEGANGTADRRFLMADQQGSVIAVQNAAGQSLATNTYDAYGLAGPANLGRFQYTGQAYIPEAGLYYYKARMYSPSLERFMQADPSGYSAGLNLYAYTHGDPINYVDRNGRFPEPVEILAGVVTGASIGAVTALVNGDSGYAAVADVFRGTVFGGLSATVSPNYFAQIGFGAITGLVSEGVSEGVSGEGFSLGKLGAAFGVGALSGAVGGGVLKLGEFGKLTSGVGKAALATTATLNAGPISILGSKGIQSIRGGSSSWNLVGSPQSGAPDDAEPNLGTTPEIIIKYNPDPITLMPVPYEIDAPPIV